MFLAVINSKISSDSYCVFILPKTLQMVYYVTQYTGLARRFFFSVKISCDLAGTSGSVISFTTTKKM